MKIVWGAMHQNDRRFGARILSGVNAVSASLYKLFLELHVSIRSRITDSAPAPRPYDGPAVVLKLHTEIVALEGNDHLGRFPWRDNQTGNVETRNIGHVFVME
ncbi:MAG TPA: hypothetical protein VG324_13990 [Blastocatellia bacterium]|nr:hypothetical protein [Blastocatellia bacterium]